MVPRPKRHHQVLVSPCDSIVLCWLPGLLPHWKKLYWWYFVEGCRQRVEVQEKADRKNGEYPSLSTAESWFFEPFVFSNSRLQPHQTSLYHSNTLTNFTPSFSSLLIVNIETNFFPYMIQKIRISPFMYLLLQYIIMPQGMFDPHMLQKVIIKSVH